MASYIPVFGLKAAGYSGGELGVAYGAFGFVNTAVEAEMNKLSVDVENGAVVVIGGITETNSGTWVATAGLNTAEATKTTEPIIESQPGTLKNRLTGQALYSLGYNVSGSIKHKGKSAKDRYDIIEIEITAGKAGATPKYTEGTEKSVGTAEVPANTTGYVTIATIFWHEATEAPEITVLRA